MSCGNVSDVSSSEREEEEQETVTARNIAATNSDIVAISTADIRCNAR